MERKLVNGDYVPDGKGGLTVLTGAEEVLQRALFRLTARRGALPFLPELCERADGLGLTVYLDWQGQELSAGLLIGEGTDEDS